MGDIHQFPDFQGPPAAGGSTGGVPKVRPGMSALEYIVATARPGEVIHVSEGDYYSKYLWRNYKDFTTRYSCT